MKNLLPAYGRLLALCLAVTAALGQEAPRLLPDRGLAGIRQQLLEIGTDLRLMCVAAHPDDEDSETLAYYNRGRGVRTSIVLANWGEGGQNEIGSELYEELGAIRARETLAAAELLGTRVYCLNQKDFGYSKTIEETWRFWRREVALERLVRVLRTERPHVVITNHRVGSGHGNHQAMAELIAEAIPLAASPEAYTAQLVEEGLVPWRVERFFQQARHHEGLPGEDYDVAIRVADPDPIRGLTFQEIAAEALNRHRSQGIKGVWGRVNAAREQSPVNAFRLVVGDRPEGKLRDLFEGMAGAWWLDGSATPFKDLGPAEAATASERQFNAALRRALSNLLVDRLKVEASVSEAIASLSARAVEVDSATEWERFPPEAVLGEKEFWSAEDMERYQRQVLETLESIGDKQRRLERILGDLWVIRLEIRNEGKSPTPGEVSEVILEVSNRGEIDVEIESLRLEAPVGWTVEGIREEGAADARATLAPGEKHTRRFHVGVAPEEPPTLPAAESLYRALRPWPSNLRGLVLLKRADRYGRVEGEYRLEIEPAWELRFHPAAPLLRADRVAETSLSLEVVRHAREPKDATVAVTFPDGQRQTLRLSGSEMLQEAVPLEWKPSSSLGVGKHSLVATLLAPDARIESRETLAFVDVAVPPDLVVGIIRSYDTTLPDALSKLGIPHALISDEDLESGDLTRFGTILVDIRGYLERPALAKANKRLLAFAEQGGHLVVFYHKTFEWNDADPPYAPYPLLLSGGRVTEEDAPVTVLAPGHRFFHFPNEIRADDWDGWIQERGLYFPDRYSSEYTELVALGDSGSEPLKGGILWAKAGKGSYVYTSLAWYRQLRGLVPGAYRLFANLITP
ncbi:MAG: Mycothiol S-conjugate amidase [bacterium]|nr:Mycothiol S-conjugate amidase [bacterium]